MRLVMLVPEFPQLSETFIVSKFLGLLERGWDVHILCSRSGPDGWQNFPALLAGGAAIRRRVHVSWPASPRWFAALLILPALVRCLLARPGQTWKYLDEGFQCFGFDVLRRLYLDAELILLGPNAVHFEFGALARERMYLKELLGCKLVVSFRGYDLNFVGLEFSEHYYVPVWEKADHLHLLGEDLWKRAIRRGCPSDKPHVLIPPAIDLKAFVPVEGDRVSQDVKSSLHILSVGRMEWKKGHEYGLQALKLVQGQGISCTYRIIGDGALFEALAFARHQLGLDGRVEFLGALGREIICRELSRADVFLHPSVSEGFCNAVIEAQAMGLPVICSDADGLSENVQDGVTGFVVPRRDPAALAEKLALLASRPELRRSMGRAGRERVEALFNLPQQIDRFDAFYRLVLGNGTRKDD